MSVNGIYGLSGSGLDVESMVKVGMMSKQNQLTKMQQTYTKNEWKKDAYLDVYNKIQEYNTSTLSTFKLSGNMNARTAESSNPLIKATANASAPAMNHTITVESTATNAYLVGTEKLGATKGGSTTLSELGIESISFTIADGTATDSGYTPATYSSATFQSNSDFFSSNAKKFHNFLQTAWNAESTALGGDDKIDKTKAALNFDVDDGSNDSPLKITYGDIYTLLNNKDATFQDFVNLLNEKIQEDDANVALTASYDSSTQSLTFTGNVPSALVGFNMSAGEGNTGAKILESIISSTHTTTDDGSIGADNDSLYLSNDNAGTAASLGAGGGGKTITLDGSKTLYDLISEVNSKGTNIRMTYDSYQDKLSIYNMKTGSNNSINIQSNNDGTTNFFNSLGLKDATNSSSPTFTAGELTTVKGTDASVIIDGDTYKEINANNLTVNGVTYTFGNVTEKTSAVVTVEQDQTKIIDNVKSFVESYNKLIGDLQDMYREAPNSSYAPLTDAQKAEMTEEQIKKWEEKAKAGMLYHDPTLRKIIDNMRNAVSGQIKGLSESGYKYDTAYSIGISTKGLYGQLQVDEDRLRAALNDDPDSVYKVFATFEYAKKLEKDENGDPLLDDAGNKVYTTTTDIDTTRSGIAQSLSQILTNAIKSVNNVAGTSKDTSDDSQLSTLLRNLQTKMSNFQSMMNAFEESLYKKYDAMESTLAMLGSQLNYVTGMFS